jgi:hypothetical protein
MITRWILRLSRARVATSTMRKYEGIVVFNPPTTRSFSGPAVPGTDAWYELTVQDLEFMLPQCVGKPIRTEHGTSEVGAITHAFFTPDGHAAIQFTFHDSDIGQQAAMLVDTKLMTGLSLCHEADSKNVKEVSICMRGARPNTGITADITAPGHKPVESNLTSYKDSTLRQGYVSASFSTRAAMEPTGNVHMLNQAQAASMQQQITQGASGTSMAYQPISNTSMDTQDTAAAAAADSETDARKRKSPDDPAPTDESMVLESMLKHRGALSDTMKAQLMGMYTEQKKAAMELKEQLAQNQGQIETLKQSAASLREHFMDVALPFMRSQLSNSDFPVADETELRRLASSDGAAPFISKFGPLMVKASSRATEKLNAAKQEVLPPDLQHQLDQYRNLKLSSTQNSRIPVGGSSRDVTASYGWQPRARGAVAPLEEEAFGDQISLQQMKLAPKRLAR